MIYNNARTRTAFHGLAFMSAFAFALVASPALADDAGGPPGECAGGTCGTPGDNGGGGCGCGGGSILVNNTDVGVTYEQSDDSDHDGIDDALDNCPYVANPDQADSDGDGVGNVCDNCAGTANKDQKPNACGDTWTSGTAGFASSAATNNVGQVIGAACDLGCAAAASAGAPITVGLTPTTSTGTTNATTPAAPSPENSGGISCAVEGVGGADLSVGVLCTGLGLALMGVTRRRRSR